MKKYLIVIPDLTLKGGVASYYYSIKNYLNDICDFFIRSTPLRGLKRIHFFLTNAIKFPFVILKNDYQFIVLNTSLSFTSVVRDIYFSITAKIFQKKTIVFIRGWVDSYFDKDIFSFRIFLLKILLQCDTIIVLSNEFKDKLEKIGIKKRIIVETTTVNEAFLSDKVKEAIIKKTGSLNSCYEIVFLARIEIYKGIYEIISAFEILKTKMPQIRLKIIGSGSQYENIKKLIIEKEISDVNLMGYLDGEDKFWELANSDLYVFLSHSEGMPNSVLEAMACGLPIITSPVGGIKDFFIEGKMGYYCSFNPDEIATLIQNLFDDNELRLAMRNSNLEYAMNNFVSSKVAQRIKNILT